MHRVAIRGAGSSGKKIAEIIAEKYPEWKVKCFVDKNDRLWGDQILNIPVVSPFKAQMMFEQDALDSVFISATLKTKAINAIIDELLEEGWNSENIYVVPVECIFEDKDDIFVHWEEVKQIPWLEYHVNDHCNLNCKGCMHFAPLSSSAFEDFEKLSRDLVRLKEIITHIERIRILGGEPLLNRELPQYLSLTRKLYPYATIELVSNGTLIHMISDELVESMISNRVLFDITLYPPLYGEIDDIVSTLRKKNIKYRVWISNRKNFTSTFSYKESDVWKKKEQCPHCSVTLRKGRIFPCHIAPYIEIFNRAFGECMPVDSGVDIYTGKLTIAKLKEELKNPMSICAFCDCSKVFPWKLAGKNPLKDDWFS